jgi:integrase
LHNFENKIAEGKVVKRNKEKFGAFGNYIKDFKAFWHWMQRTEKVTEDITSDLSSKTDKPAWVYLSEAQAKKFFNKLNSYYRVICWFMYDSGARVTEANSIQIRHFSKDFKQVTIPEEAAKTFERTINLKLCSDLIKEYVANENLKDDDFLFSKDLWTTNKYLKENCGKLFGKDKISNARAKGNYGNFTLYDIRHNSACFWLNRYPTQSALMYRMGWKSADKIEYYTNFLGQGDKLTDGDMISGEDKPKLYLLEKEVGELKGDNQKMREQMKELLELVNEMTTKTLEVDRRVNGR